MDEEFNALCENETFELTSLTEGRTTVGGKVGLCSKTRSKWNRLLRDFFTNCPYNLSSHVNAVSCSKGYGSYEHTNNLVSTKNFSSYQIFKAIGPRSRTLGVKDLYYKAKCIVRILLNSSVRFLSKIIPKCIQLINFVIFSLFFFDSRVQSNLY